MEVTMSTSITQLNLSQNTLEEIALSALPFLQALGLEVDSANSNKVDRNSDTPQNILAGLPFGIDDLGPLIVWK